MLKAISRYGARVLPNTDQIVDTLDAKGQLIEGPHIAAFEEAFARRLGNVRAISASFGRMAFYYILRALNFPPGSEIVLPAFTFWVMPEIARTAGLVPVFADIDPATFNVTAESLARVVGPRTRAVVPTHMWGLPCDMDEILSLARRKGLVVIEDCAHALGATYQGRPVGTLGDAAIFSFQTLKPLNTYGGGMAVTGDCDLAERVARLVAAEPPPTRKGVQKLLWRGRVQRISIRPGVFTWTLFPVLWTSSLIDAQPDVYLWEAIRPLSPLPEGYAERYSNVQAAIGLEGLKYLDRWTQATQVHAARIAASLKGLPGVSIPSVPSDRTHVFYQYCAYVPDRDAVVRRCLRQGVDLETLHIDVCTKLDIFKERATRAPGAEFTERAIQIPVYASLSTAEVERVGSVVRQAAANGRHAVLASAARR